VSADTGSTVDGGGLPDSEVDGLRVVEDRSHCGGGCGHVLHLRTVQGTCRHGVVASGDLGSGTIANAILQSIGDAEEHYRSGGERDLREAHCDLGLSVSGGRWIRKTAACKRSEERGERKLSQTNTGAGSDGERWFARSFWEGNQRRWAEKQVNEVNHVWEGAPPSLSRTVRGEMTSRQHKQHT